MPKIKARTKATSVTDENTAINNAHVVGAEDKDDMRRGGSDSHDDTDNSIHPPEAKLTLWDEVQHSLSDRLLPLLTRPEKLFTTLLLSNGDEHADDVDIAVDSAVANREAARVKPTRQQLLLTSQQLFRYIEHLASMEIKLRELQKKQKLDGGEATNEEGEDEEIEDEPCSLSGLSSLYTGNESSTISNNATMALGVVVDAETIWGQVDLQNQELVTRLKKLIKKLSKRSVPASDDGNDERVIRILHTGSKMDSDDDGDEEDEEKMSMGSAASDFELNDKDEEDRGSDEDNDDNVNPDQRRIRERMEKAMADMSDDEEENTYDNDDDDDDGHIIELTSARKSQARDESDTDSNHEDTIDQTREDLRDGFFDLHEMEAFADEEEEMLPDDAYGKESPDDILEATKGKAMKKSILPHVRDRLGIDSEEDDDEKDDEGFDDEEDPLSKRFQPTSVRRKKYRADDEVDALCEWTNGLPHQYALLLFLSLFLLRRLSSSFTPHLVCAKNQLFQITFMRASTIMMRIQMIGKMTKSSTHRL